jgi:hypothetical protein
VTDLELAEKTEIGGLRIVPPTIADIETTISHRASGKAIYRRRQTVGSNLRKTLRL